MAETIFIARDPQITQLMDTIAMEMAARGLNVVRGPMPTQGAKLVYPVSEHARLFGKASVLMFSGQSVCSRQVLRSASRLRGVVYPAVGIETLDIAAATEMGVIVGHGAIPENAQGMAEATVMLLLALGMQLHRSERALREHQPKPGPENNWVGQLHGKTIGFVGFGRIARAASRLLQPFGVKLIAYHPNHLPQADDEPVSWVGLDELLSTADFVSLHVTLNETSKAMIGARELSLMKPTAYLLNTARGQVVDEQALIEALKASSIAGAALDTFEVEPLPANSPLRTLDNVILTPHMVGQTRESISALIPAAVENIERVLDGRLPLYCKNPEIEERWRERLNAL